MSLKIGLVGASCTGKTTLSEEISNLFNLEIIGETARELFNEFNISSPRNLETLSDELKFQNRILFHADWKIIATMGWSKECIEMFSPHFNFAFQKGRIFT